MPADLIWSQGSAFNNRLVQEINAENTAIDLVVYRLTVPSITNALLTKISQRVPIRLLLEPTQYWTPPNNPPQGARVWPEYWLTKAYIDKLWAAGLDTIKQRNHVGLTHMKLLVTSRFATIASSNFAEGWQRDHDYFVPSTKPIYTALKNRFATMYASSGFTTFTPTPPDAATLATPAANATAVAATPTLTWSRAPFATSYDVFIWPSGSAQPASPVGNVPAVLNNNPPTTYSFTASLQGGTTYNWRIRSRTFAADRNPIYVAQSATRSFTTVGTGSGGQTPTLPSPWQTQDIGSVAQPGSASEANGVFTVSGSGSNIWGTADSFRYVYQTTSGDTQITARVPNPVQNTGTYAKVGVMLRASTAANAANVLLSVRPNGSLEFMSRSSTGGQTTFYGTRTQPAPAWLRLTRSGSTVTAEVSSNGSTWFQVGQPIAFSSGSLAGLIVCATSSSLNTATFDNVSVSGTVTPPPPPPPPTAGNIVIYASDVPSAGVPPTSSWTPASDASSPGGVKLTTPDAGQPASASASSSPIHYFDVNFTAQTGTAYRVWFRLRAQNNSKLNDAIWAQFSGALANGSPIYRINTTSGLLVNLATTTEATSLNNWGWQNTAYWLSQPTALTFASTNQTLRVQIREDGVEIDQIVLSPSQFFNSAPGPVTNDSTIVAKP